VYGEDKIFYLPLMVCMPCQVTLKRPSILKECLRAVPEYRQLLDKFPDAKVSFPQRPYIMGRKPL